MDTTTSPPTPETDSRLALPAGVPTTALVVAGTVTIVLLGLLVGLRIARAGALPGVVVGDVEVGGQDDERLRASIDGLARRRAARTVQAVTPFGEVSSAAEALGYRVDVEATMAAALHRGRQGNPLAALFDQLRAFGGTLRVAPVEEVEEGVLADWVDDAAERLEQPPVEGNLHFDGTTITRVDPIPGATVDRAALTEQAQEALLGDEGLGDEGLRLEVPTTPTDPRTTPADVDRVLAEAERAVSAPVRLTRNDVALTFSPEEIGSLLAVEPAEDGGGLRLFVPQERMTAAVSPERRAALASEPADADFRAGGGAVEVVPSRDGFAFSDAKAAAQLVAVATGPGPREAELDGDLVAPSFSTEDAEALKIVERVSTFTTEHKCCQGRVTNIHRIADLVDGAIIKPGQTFSLNGHVGERTAAKGFVPGGAIQAGEFVDEIGGGVSQFTTTMFNAAFFGGYAIPEHKAHSYYISRYPVGREATLDYPSVDLKIRNNSPAGILVKTSYTATSITVSFYGTKWVDVESSTGERRNFKEPTTEYRENPDLKPGQERVVQSPAQGFDITVTRVLRFPDGRVEREEFFTRYLAQPQIIERNSASPAPSPSPSPGSSPAPEPSPSGDGE